MQIGESKFGKRKYHRGHKVEGQWVFGGIEEGSWKRFMFAVDDRSEATLLPKEFVNKDGDHTNKIEGHGHQAKAKFPPFGIRKYTFSSYLVDILWRYEHKGDDLFEVFLDDAKKIYGVGF